MSTRERQPERPPRETPPVENAASGAGLEGLAQEGAAFAAAASDIINAALSGDSTAFLASNRQMSGQ